MLDVFHFTNHISLFTDSHFTFYKNSHIMNTELLGVIGIFILTIVLAIPLGKYIAKVYLGDKTLLDPIFNPIEKFIFKISGINPAEEMNWKQHLKALLSINMIWFFLCFFVLLSQGSLPLNPDNNPSMAPDLAFNTAISFLVNCNLQHYSGESGVSYLSQIVLMFLQFVSAGIGLAAAAMVFTAMKERTTEKLGNFYNYFIKSCTRILLPLSQNHKRRNCSIAYYNQVEYSSYSTPFQA